MLQRALLRLEQLSAIGGSDRDERVRRATLLLLSLITSLAGAIWGFSYLLLGFPTVALVPFATTSTMARTSARRPSATSAPGSACTWRW